MWVVFIYFGRPFRCAGKHAREHDEQRPSHRGRRAPSPLLHEGCGSELGAEPGGEASPVGRLCCSCWPPPVEGPVARSAQIFGKVVPRRETGSPRHWVSRFGPGLARPAQIRANDRGDLPIDSAMLNGHVAWSRWSGLGRFTCGV